jgi:hypothetical protein
MNKTEQIVFVEKDLRSGVIQRDAPVGCAAPDIPYITW